jgi:large repetitive protein
VGRLTLISLASIVLLTLGLPPSADAQSPSSALNRWTHTADLTTARSAACAVVLNDGRLLVAGGQGDSGSVSAVDIYGTDGVFSAGPPMTQARARAACVALADGRVLVAGGNDGSGSLSTAEIFDPSGNKWQPTGSLSVGREGHQMAMTPWGFPWVAGGTSNGVITGAMELFNPATGQFQAIGVLNTARAEFAMTAVGRTLLIAGGTDGTKTLSSVEIYDGATGKITVAGAMSQPRKDFAAAALLDGTLLMTGGVDVNGLTLTSTEIFDPVKGTSTAGPSLLEPRANHSAYAMLHNGSVLIYGGSGNSGVLGTTELYTPWSGSIAQGNPLNNARRDEAKSALRAGGYMIAGGRNDLSYLSGSELFQFSTIATDKGDYAPGTAVKISGGGWVPGEQVLVSITAFPVDLHHIEFTGAAVADGAGNITVAGFAVDKSHLGMKFLMTATGSQSEAQTTFTDGIDPVIAYTFSPLSGTGPTPAGGVAVTVTLTPPAPSSNPTPTGTIIPCTGGSCPTNLTITGASCTAESCTLSQQGATNIATVTFNIPFPLGSTSFSIEYSGDANYNSEAMSAGTTPPGAPIFPYVAQNFTITDLTGGPASPAPYGTQTPYVANVCLSSTGAACDTTGTFLGKVQFSVSGSPSVGPALSGAYGLPVAITQTGGGTGTANFVPNPPLPVGGPYTITATYANDAAASSSNSSAANGGAASISTTIQQDTTTTTFTITDADSTGATQIGRVITLNATTVTGANQFGTPTGTFTFNFPQGAVAVNNTSLSGACGNLTNGAHSATVTLTNPSVTMGAGGFGTSTASCTFIITAPVQTNTDTVTYNGDANTATSTSAAQTITTILAPTTTTFTITDADSTGATQIGRVITLNATAVTGANVFDSPTGTFTFNFPQGAVAMNNTSLSGACGNLTNGAHSATVTLTVPSLNTTVGGFGTATASCTFIITAPAAQTNTYTVTYNGDTSTATSTSAAQTITTILAGTTTTFTITDSDPTGATQIGRVITLNATAVTGANVFDSPTGTFTFNFPQGAVALNNTSLPGACGNLTNGAHSATVTLTSPNLATTVGGFGTATASCTFIITAPVQTNTYTVTYNGDTNTATSTSAAQTITTILAATTTTFTITDADPTNTTQIDRVITLNATTVTGANVFDSPTGTFTFNFPQGAEAVNNTSLSGACGNLTNGAHSATVTLTNPSLTTTVGGGGRSTASCTFIITAPAQTDTYTVTYNGDTNTAASTSTAQTITTIPDGTTTTFAIVDPDSTGATQIGRVITLNATTVTGANVFDSPTGTFTFNFPQGAVAVNNTSLPGACGNLANGAHSATVTLTSPSLTTTVGGFGTSTASCTFIITAPAAQTNTYTVTYNGDSNTAASTSAAQTITTILAGTTATFTITDSDSTGATQIGRVITLNATTVTGANVFDSPTGTFTFNFPQGAVAVNNTSLLGACGNLTNGAHSATVTLTSPSLTTTLGGFGTATASCTFIITAPAQQTNTYTVTYNGDTNTAISTSAQQTITTILAATTTTFTITDADPTGATQIGRLIKLSATTNTGANVFDTPTGTFTFSFPQGAVAVNNTTLPGACGSIANGAHSATVTLTSPSLSTASGGGGTSTASCTFIITAPAAQVNTYTVNYNADTNTATSPQAATQTITTTLAATNTTLTFSSLDGSNSTQLGRLVTLTAITYTNQNVFVQPSNSLSFAVPAADAFLSNCGSPVYSGGTNFATTGTNAPNGQVTATCTFIVVGPSGGTAQTPYTASHAVDVSTNASSDIESLTTTYDGTALGACVSTNGGTCANTGNVFYYGQSISFSATLCSNTGLPGDNILPNRSVGFSNALTFATPILSSGTPLACALGQTVAGNATWNVASLPPASSSLYNVNLNYPPAQSALDPDYGASATQVTFMEKQANTVTVVQPLTVPAGVANVKIVVYNCTLLGSTCTLLGGNPTGTVQLVLGGTAPQASSPNGLASSSSNGAINGGTVIGTALLTPSSNCGVTSPGGVAVSSCSVATLLVPGGSYSANYLGDNNFASSNSLGGATGPPPSVTSVTATSSVALTFAPPLANPGTQVTLTATVSGTGGGSSPTGSVTFYDNGVLLAVQQLGVNGAATWTYIPGPGSSHTIVANYSGDAIYPSGTATSGLTITKLTATTPSSVNGTTTVYGQPANLAVRIAPGPNQPGAPVPTGTVQYFVVNGNNVGTPVPLVNGSATLQYAGFAAGTYTIGITYSGDPNFNSFTNTIGTITVNRAQVTVALGTPTTSNGQMTLTATLTVVAPGAGTPTGTVAFKDTFTGTTLMTANVSGGTATATVPVTGDPIVAAYSGDANFLSASSVSANAATITALNAASDVAAFAADTIVSIYGSALTPQTVSGTSPLQSTLGGIAVTVMDSAGVPRQALLFFVSPGQINLLIPAGTATGPATITVNTPNGAITTTINIAPSIAALFTANNNGSGPLAAQVVAVAPGGQQTYTNTAALSGTTLVNAPISLSPAADTFYLLLYGTGFDTAKTVTVTINGQTFTPAYFGPQGGFAGLDQANVLLPASLAGSGQVNVSITVDGQTSNVGTIAFGAAGTN